MSILQIIGGLFKLLVMFFQVKVERDADLKKRKGEIYAESKAAVKDRDISKLNVAIDKLGRL